ncbi:sensor histidine kinase [Sphingomonas faeni]|uniref:sensor histidine kinase n=1 Tax=Sphingomonas faeni TaxID=185950 RepID=UPI0027D81931|nr:sensor histidine kinase [Sphingomonas faeni]
MVFALIFLLGGYSTVTKADAQPQITHSSWTTADGVPGMVSALAQTPDGYLWLGTYEGLYRFDGVTFERIPPATGHPSGAIPVTAVFVTRNGKLFVGYAGRGGVEVYRNGHLIRASMPSAPGEVTSFAEDGDGAIFAIGGREPGALYRLWRGSWQRLGQNWGLPSETIWSVFVAKDGTVWVATAKHLFFLRSGAFRFEDTGEKLTDGAGFAQDRRGDIWISGPFGTRMVADYPHGHRRPRKPVFYSALAPVSRVALLFARDGALWGSTYTDGLFRIDSPGRTQPGRAAIQRFRTNDGMTSNQAVAILQDRENNIWAATENGLDQFRKADVEQVRLPPQTSPRGYKMAVDPSGAIYVASGKTLYRTDAGGDPVAVTAAKQPSALCSDPSGGIWMAVARRMIRFRGGRMIVNEVVPGPEPVTGCGVDRSGRLWLAQPNAGVLVLDRGTWRRFALPRMGQRPKDIIIDRAGNPVVMFSNRALLLVSADGAARYLDGDTIGVSGLTGVFPMDFGLLVAGGTGMALWNGHEFRRLSIDEYPWLRGVRGLVQTKDGETWMLNNKGVHRVASARFEAAFDHPHTALPHLTLGPEDGLSSHPTGEEGAQAAVAEDGRIWFMTRQNAVRVDPRRLISNPRPPSVLIRGLTANGRRYPDPRSVDLPAGTRNLSISYTALSLSVPSRVRFRYKLAGVDADWVDPGSRREAFYTNLGPGSYRFRVIASNDKGIWNRQGVELRIMIPPTFLQSALFQVLCFILAALLLWFLLDLRVRNLTRRMRIRVAERTNERERIARELHDTLLQGIHGLMLRFHIAAQSVGDDRVRRELEDAMNLADDVLIDGRDRVSALRAVDSSDLEGIVLALIERQDFPPDVRINFTIKGRVRSVEHDVVAEVGGIVGEALFNIRRHASASAVTVALTFNRFSMTLSIRDDGVGIPEDVLKAGGRSGHFGLIGMRERAKQLGARLWIRSGVWKGTEVRLIIPALVVSSRSKPIAPV